MTRSADAGISACLEAGRLAVIGSDRFVPYWSFGKTLVAAIALRLVEQGRLDLDRAIDERGFSLRQLLAHRAGLPDYGGLASYHAMVEARETPWSADRFLIETCAERLESAPGSRFRYSNIGYLLVVRHLEAATGAGLGELVAGVLTRPLGLGSIRHVKTPGDLGEVDMGGVVGYHPGYVAHGLFAGTVSDAARALDAILGEEFLLAKTREVMASALPVGGPVPGRPWTRPGYGLGVMSGEISAGFTITGHTGAGPGSRIAVYRRQPSGPVAAVFVPSDEGGDGVSEFRCVSLLEDENGTPGGNCPSRRD